MKNPFRVTLLSMILVGLVLALSAWNDQSATSQDEVVAHVEAAPIQAIEAPETLFGQDIQLASCNPDPFFCYETFTFCMADCKKPGASPGCEDKCVDDYEECATCSHWIIIPGPIV